MEGERKMENDDRPQAPNGNVSPRVSQAGSSPKNDNGITFMPEGIEMAPILDNNEIRHWSFYRAVIAEFVATLLFLYISLTTIAGANRIDAGSLGNLEVAWSFGGMIFILVYCIAGLSGTPPSLFTMQAHQSYNKLLSLGVHDTLPSRRVVRTPPGFGCPV